MINIDQYNCNNNNGHQSNYEVLIVGCGPNGGLLANLLGQLGIKTLIVESANTFTQVPRAAHLDDEGLRILKRVGLDEEVLKQSFQLDVKFNKSFSNGNLTTIKPSITELNFPRSIFWFQPKFEETIRNGFLKRYSHCVDLITNCQVVSIKKQDGDDDDGDDGEDEDYGNLKINNIKIKNLKNGEISKLKSKFIIGSDGGNSFIRKSISSKMQGTSSKMRWLVIDAKIHKGHPPLPHYFQFICNPNRPALTLPIPPDHFRWEFVVFENESSEEMEKPENLYPLLISHGADISKIEIIRKSCYSFQNRLADNWYNGDSTLLVGDACHLVPPFLGMGISSGFRDVLNISWKIDLILKSQQGDLGGGRGGSNACNLISNPQSLLNSYQIERQPNIEIITHHATQAGNIIMMSNKYKAFLRNILLSTLLSIPSIEKLFHNKAGMKPPTTIHNGLLDKLSSFKSINNNNEDLVDTSKYLIKPSKIIVGESIPQPFVNLIYPSSSSSSSTSILLDDILGIGFSCLFFNFNIENKKNNKLISKLINNQLFSILNTQFIQVLSNNNNNSVSLSSSSTSSSSSSLNSDNFINGINSVIIDDLNETLSKFIFGEESTSTTACKLPTIIIIRPDKFIFGIYNNFNLKYSNIISSLMNILSINNDYLNCNTNPNYSNTSVNDSANNSESENSFDSFIHSDDE